MPKHNPTHEKLPALADEWFIRYDAGYDCTRWYTAESGERRTESAAAVVN